MRWLALAVSSAVSALMLSAPVMQPPALAHSFPAPLTAISYDQVEGWAQDNHAAAFEAFARTCQRATQSAPRSRSNGVDGTVLAEICAGIAPSDIADPRAFFERHFTPYRVEAGGLLTGYFEPQLRASFARTGAFQYPLYARPPDLVELPGPAASLGISDDVTWGRASDGGFEAFPDRSQIMAGALDGRGLELVYLESAVDAFFVHIQGSARLSMTDGSVQRVNFAGKSGHAYTPIGRTLVNQGALALEHVTMDSIRAWLLAAGPAERDIVLASNRSFIFFAMVQDFDADAGPVAAANVPLTPGRSLAVDRHLHTFGTPIFVASPDALPGQDVPLSRLMIAQDTGSAIIGPARGDIFIGSGAQAGAVAGAVNQPVTFTLLIPTSGDAGRVR